MHDEESGVVTIKQVKKSYSPWSSKIYGVNQTGQQNNPIILSTMKKYKFKISGNEYEVHIKDFEDNIANIEVNGTAYSVEIDKEIKTSKTPQLIRKPVEQKPGEGYIQKTPSTGMYKVTSPLPGTIIKINIKVGDTVTENQNLMVMEAMKMENQILTQKAGVVNSIKVNVGDTVMQDDVLIEIGQ